MGTAGLDYSSLASSTDRTWCRRPRFAGGLNLTVDRETVFPDAVATNSTGSLWKRARSFFPRWLREIRTFFVWPAGIIAVALPSSMVFFVVFVGPFDAVMAVTLLFLIFSVTESVSFTEQVVPPAAHPTGTVTVVPFVLARPILTLAV